MARSGRLRAIRAAIRRSAVSMQFTKLCPLRNERGFDGLGRVGGLGRKRDV